MIARIFDQQWLTAKNNNYAKEIIREIQPEKIKWSAMKRKDSARGTPKDPFSEKSQCSDTMLQLLKLFLIDWNGPHTREFIHGWSAKKLKTNPYKIGIFHNESSTKIKIQNKKSPNQKVIEARYGFLLWLKQIDKGSKQILM